MCIVPSFPKTLLNYDDALHRNIQSLRRVSREKAEADSTTLSLHTQTTNAVTTSQVLTCIFPCYRRE